MPSARAIMTTMIKKGIPEDTLSQFVLPDPASKGAQWSEEYVGFIGQMDRLLTGEQRLSIMQEQGCSVSGKPAAAHMAFGRAHAGLLLEDKVRLYNESDIMYQLPCRLNPGGTLTVAWSHGKAGEYSCVCGIFAKLPQPAAVSPTFCGCCGGHARQNLQRALGVKLRLKEIVSSAASTRGERSCAFRFEILNA